MHCNVFGLFAPPIKILKQRTNMEYLSKDLGMEIAFSAFTDINFAEECEKNSEFYLEVG